MVATLYLGNLNPACNEDMIGRSFTRFGDIQKSKLLIFKRLRCLQCVKCQIALGENVAG